MLFKPSYTKPYLTPIDATVNNTFSCYLNSEGGTNINKYKLLINDLNGNTVYNTGDVTLSPVLYNKDTLNITVPSTSGMINGIDYVWNILLYENNPNIWVTYGTVQSTSTTTNVYIRSHYNVSEGMYLKIGNESRLISSYNSTTGLAVVSAFTSAPSVGVQYNIYKNYVNSDDIYFKARSTPVISITNYSSTISNRSFTFSGSYSQSDGINWKYYTFNLYDVDGNIIDTTNEVNTGIITYTFDGFSNDTSYSIELIIETQDGIIVTTGKKSFSVSYSVTTIWNTPVYVENIESKNALKASWGQPYINLSSVSGETAPYYEYISNSPSSGKKSIKLYKGTTLNYSVKTSLGRMFVPYNSTLSCRIRLPIAFSGNIIELYNDVTDDYYIVSYDNGIFSFDINGLYTGTIRAFYPTSSWLLDSTYISKNEYVWDDTQIWDDSKFFYEQSEDDLNNSWCEFTLLPDTVLLTTVPISDPSSPVERTAVVNSGTGTQPSGYYSLNIYGEQTCDYVWIRNKVVTQTEIDQTKDLNFEPTWDRNTMLMALFDNNLDAGSVSSVTGNITEWSIYRRNKDGNRLYFVKSVDVSTTSIIDYNISNKITYQYYVFPITSSTVGGSMYSDEIIPCWWNWSLTGLLPTTTDGLYYADTDNIWIFKGNISSGSITQNIDKTIYQGFTKYPKISVGNRNYVSGTLTCLIGSMVNASYSTETLARFKNFLSFIKSEGKKMLKDPKGNVYLVDTTENTFSIEDVISDQPVSASFNWAEIGDLSEFSIIEQ